MLLFIPMILLVIFGQTMNIPVLGSKAEALTVVIDAGHGGIDGGVVGSLNIKESDINLEVAKKVKALFEGAGIAVVMTRSTPQGLYGTMSKGFKKRDLAERVRITNSSKANMFISVHMNNNGDRNRRGVQVYYKIDDNESKKLASYLQGSFNQMAESVRSCQILSGDFYVLNGANIPAVICECGFISNKEDEALLVSSEYQEKLAYAIFQGAINYLIENDVEAYKILNER